MNLFSSIGVYTPIEERLESLGIDDDFMRFLLYWCGVLGFKKEPVTDKRFQQYFGKKKIEFYQTLFSKAPISNPPNRPPKVFFWLAVSYLCDYFLEITQRPHWRLIEEFLQSFKLWGKTSLKTEWYKKGKRNIIAYIAEQYKPNISDLHKFYLSNKKHILIGMCKASVGSEKPIFWVAKLVYSG